MSILRTCKILERSIWTLLAFYCGSWPPQNQVAIEIDGTQRRMYSSTLRLRRNDGESIPAYVRRRNKAAKQLLEQTGLWSSRWFAKATSWDEHLQRDLAQQLLHVEQDVPAELVASCFSWGPALLGYQDESFLNERRIVTRRGSFSDRVAYRTGLRSGQRKVHPRWSSAVKSLRHGNSICVYGTYLQRCSFYVISFFP